MQCVGGWWEVFMRGKRVPFETERPPSEDDIEILN